MRYRRVIPIFIASISALVVVVVTSQAMGGPGGPGTLEGAPAFDSLQAVESVGATFGEDEGDRVVLLQATPDGWFCLWDASARGSEDRRGGCNPASNPLGGKKLSASLTFDGGPGVTRARSARIVGVTEELVEHVDIVLSDGSKLDAPLVPFSNSAVIDRDLKVFAVAIPDEMLRRGVEPREVVALDGENVVVGRQRTGVEP